MLSQSQELEQGMSLKLTKNEEDLSNFNGE